MLQQIHKLKNIKKLSHFQFFRFSQNQQQDDEIPKIDGVDDVNDPDKSQTKKKNHKSFQSKYIYKYNFQNQTFCFPLELPLFPLSKQEILLSADKYKTLQRQSSFFLTAVTLKSDTKKDNLSIDDVYKIGTYCKADLLVRGGYQLKLTALHRIQIDNIYYEQIQPIVSDPVEVQEEVDVVPVHEDKEEQPHEETDNVDNADVDKQQARKEVYKLIKQAQQKQNIAILTEQDDQYLISQQSILDDLPDFQMTIEIEAKLKHLIDLYSKILYMNKSQIPLVNYNLGDAYRIIDSLGGFLASQKYFPVTELQDAFEQINLNDRLEKVHQMMNKYFLFLQYFSDVGQIAKQNIKAQKAQEFYDEVFKIVQSSVKGKRGKEAVLDKLLKEIKSKKPPQNVMKIFNQESSRYMRMDEMSSESNIIRTYLEWLVSIPYGVISEDNLELDKAKAVLDKGHYGMDDVKDRILEFIAIGKLRNSLQGKILCLVGPPGTGKTSLASSIAKALNRNFSRVSMGGESDSSFLKGHRKTYIGSYPGKIIQCFKECQTENCVILLDEIDKLGKSEVHGDPQSNLLEILDPEQNINFTDNYLDFPVDLSKVLFICSANITDTISGPLLDRMDVIHLSSYTTKDKQEIFRKHLLPKALEESGIDKDTCQKIKITDEALLSLINDYCREPGIRSLDKYTKKMIDKISYKIVTNNMNNKEQVIDKDDLVPIIGQPNFQEIKFYQQTPIGVVIGLAYTEYGGSLIFIEAAQSSYSSDPKKMANLKITGSLGTVMKESMQIAYSYARVFCGKLGNNFLEQNEVHIHAPEGAIPKDGPSAGITICSSLISLALQRPAIQNIAMTGEISLRGMVMKIGGVKEKVLVAQREGIKQLIFPLENKNDVDELKEEVKENITFHYVSDYHEVYKLLFESPK